MAKIEVGMLVKVLPGPNPEKTRLFAGHVGRVLRQCYVYPDYWTVEGAEFLPNGRRISFHPRHLQPIDPPKTTTWDHVAETTGGWNPTKQKEPSNAS